MEEFTMLRNKLSWFVVILVLLVSSIAMAEECLDPRIIEDGAILCRDKPTWTQRYVFADLESVELLKDHKECIAEAIANGDAECTLLEEVEADILAPFPDRYISKSVTASITVVKDRVVVIKESSVVRKTWNYGRRIVLALPILMSLVMAFVSGWFEDGQWKLPAIGLLFISGFLFCFGAVVSGITFLLFMLSAILLKLWGKSLQERKKYLRETSPKE